MIELELGNKEDLLAKGREKREQNLKQNAPDLSQIDKSVSPPHNTQKAIAKAAGVSTGQVGMAEQVRKKAPDLSQNDKSEPEPPPHRTRETIAKAERDKRIFDLWMQCWTQEQIADVVGCSVGQVNSICSEMADLPKLNKSDQAAAEHATDFDVPIYNVWKQQSKATDGRGKTGGLSEYARAVGRGHNTISEYVSAARVLENLSVDRHLLLDKSQHLSKIHTLPEVTWPAAVGEDQGIACSTIRNTHQGIFGCLKKCLIYMRQSRETLFQNRGKCSVGRRGWRGKALFRPVARALFLAREKVAFVTLGRGFFDQDARQGERGN